MDSFLHVPAEVAEKKLATSCCAPQPQCSFVPVHRAAPIVNEQRPGNYERKHLGAAHFRGKGFAVPEVVRSFAFCISLLNVVDILDFFNVVSLIFIS